MEGGIMTIELNKEEKVVIVNQHLKDLAYSAYNLELSLIEVNASSNPNQDNIDSLNSQMQDINNRKLALQSELDLLNQ